jgi:Protein of unknown function (DUF2934)
VAKSSAARATAQRQEIHKEDGQATQTRSNAPKEVPQLPTEVTTEMASEGLRALVAVAAYLRAENRGFAPGYEVEDWLMAETEIMMRLGLRIRDIN